MANAEHLKILKEGVERWNRWREENPGLVPDLSEAQLNGAQLSDYNLKDVILSGADLREANLCRANLTGADLQNADLSEARIIAASLVGANLTSAILTKANLFDSNLQKANLSKSDLSEANLIAVDFTYAVLIEASLRGAILRMANFEGANLSDANLEDTNLTAVSEKKPTKGPSKLIDDQNVFPSDQNIESPTTLPTNRTFFFRWALGANDETATNTWENSILNFESIFPSPFRLNTWQDILVYVCVSQALVKVLFDFERRKGLLTGTYSGSSAESQTQIPRDSLLTIIPDIPSVECNPPSIQFKMTEDYHCLQFRVRHQASPLVERLGSGRIQGTISVYLETLLIGEIPVQSTWETPGAAPSPASRSMLINSIAASPEPEKPKEDFKRQQAQAFRKIFVSYSHQDAPIIEGLGKAYKVIGDDYWRDIQSLRSGQKWSNEIETAINGSDVFQLCWSNQSKSSEFVEREWRAALQRRTENFIRPLYWEKPMPEAPEELGHLHFAYYPLGG